jgi:hypothetical protein
MATTDQHTRNVEYARQACTLALRKASQIQADMRQHQARIDFEAGRDPAPGDATNWSALAGAFAAVDILGVRLERANRELAQAQETLRRLDQ